MARLGEYQSNQILERHAVEIPRSAIAVSSEEARRIAEKLAGETVVKAQIHATSRAASGGIKVASDAADFGFDRLLYLSNRRWNFDLGKSVDEGENGSFSHSKRSDKFSHPRRYCSTF